MTEHILALATASPPHVFRQMDVAETMIDLMQMDQQEGDYLRKLYRNTTIETRHSVLADFNMSRKQWGFWGSTYPDKIPGTLARNEVYKNEAQKLAKEAASKAIQQWGGNSQDITHVVTVSCTGVCVPGIEFQLIDDLNLSWDVARLGVNFMGCFGAFQGISVARAFASENPKNRVLVVCVELCSLHMQADRKPETLIANALFSDGAASFIVGQKDKSFEKPLWEIVKRSSLGIGNSQKEITWDIGDAGFFMQLTKEVPPLIRRNIREFIDNLIDQRANLGECDWAIHPGGKAIIHAVEQSAALTKEQTEATWKIFRRHGNMSSSTVLYMLHELQKGEKEWCVGLGFGPGLSVEGALLRRSS